MSQVIRPATFTACGSIQSYVVPVAGNYVIAAAGAQGGEGTQAGGKGAFVQGLFYLREGDLLNFLVGTQGSPGGNPAFATEYSACGGGGGGGSFVWKANAQGERPIWPLLVAGGGGGGGRQEGGEGRARSGSSVRGHAASAEPWQPLTTFRHFGGGGGSGWARDGDQGPGPVYCRGGTRWAGGEGVAYAEMCGGDGGYGGGGGGGFLGYASGGGGGFEGGAGGGEVACHRDQVARSQGGTSYNAGREQTNFAGFRAGDGHASIIAVLTPILFESLAPRLGIGPRSAADLAKSRP